MGFTKYKNGINERKIEQEIRQNICKKKKGNRLNNIKEKRKNLAWKLSWVWVRKVEQSNEGKRE